MSFVPRVHVRPHIFTTRRSYSFLSNKAGRPWFAASKAAAAKQRQGRDAPPHSVSGTEPVDRDGVKLVAEGMKEGTMSDTQSGTSAAEEPSLSATVSISNALTWPAPSSPPLDHPQPSLPSLILQRFYSIDRPLLSLQLPRTTTSSTPAEDVDSEAEADAARLLARALVMNKLGAEKDWNTVLRRLDGKEEEEPRISLDSVKRKRRKKMSKHKYKKRRKLQRSERRRLGK